MTRITKSKSPKMHLMQRRAARRLSERNWALSLKISQMRLNIAPIVHVVTGNPAPDFPYTMLSFFLLTEDQLDALAQFYSQDTLSDLTFAYPQIMRWNQDFLSRNTAMLPENCKLTDLERLKIKMRMFARFVGMSGADTPIWEYERQLEILRNDVARRVRLEDMTLNKFYRGPLTSPR